MFKVKVKVTQPCLTLCNPMDYTVHGILQTRILEWVAYPSPADLPNPGIKLGPLHCRQILYQLSYQGRSVYHEHSTNVSLKATRHKAPQKTLRQTKKAAQPKGTFCRERLVIMQLGGKGWEASKGLLSVSWGRAGVLAGSRL